MRCGLSHHARARSLQEKSLPRVTRATQIDASFQAAQPSCSVMIKSCGFAAPPRSGCALHACREAEATQVHCGKQGVQEQQCSATRHIPRNCASRRFTKKKGPLLRGGPCHRGGPITGDRWRSPARSTSPNVRDSRDCRSPRRPDLDDVLTVGNRLRQVPGVPVAVVAVAVDARAVPREREETRARGIARQVLLIKAQVKEQGERVRPI